MSSSICFVSPKHPSALNPMVPRSTIYFLRCCDIWSCLIYFQGTDIPTWWRSVRRSVHQGLMTWRSTQRIVLSSVIRIMSSMRWFPVLASKCWWDLPLVLISGFGRSIPGDWASLCSHGKRARASNLIMFLDGLMIKVFTIPTWYILVLLFKNMICYEGP
jgi:hypothetical protein